MGLLIPNSTQIPNFLLDRIMPLIEPAEWKVLSVICRKTFGWQKFEDRVSLSQFEKATGLSRPWLVKILARFTKSGLVVKKHSSRGDIYSMNLESNVTQVISKLHGDPEVSLPINGVNQLTETATTGSLSSPQPVNRVNTQKPIKTNKPKKDLSCPGEQEPTDPRHQPIREHIRKRHAESNQMSLELVPWSAPEGVALRKLLKDSPNLSVQDACRCVDNYYLSDVNISAKPRKWIPDLLEFWVGSLNQFKTPRMFDREHQRQAEKRAHANVGVYTGAPERSGLPDADAGPMKPSGGTE